MQIARVKLHRFCTQGHVCAGVRGGEDDSSNGCYSSTTNKSPGLNWCRISLLEEREMGSNAYNKL